MKKLHGVGVCLLYLQTYLCLVSGERLIYQAGDNARVPCGINSESIEWRKDKIIILKYPKPQRPFGMTDTSQFSIPDRATNDLEISNVKVSDSGNYICLKDTKTKMVEVVVIQVLAHPSTTLIASENLILTLETPSGLPLIVSWWKDKEKLGDGSTLNKNNMQIEDSGNYRAEIDNKPKTPFQATVSITVSGFYHSPSIVYTSGKGPIIIPWSFNFNVRQTPLEKHPRAAGGNITYAPQWVKPLTVENGAVCWQKTCDTKTQDPRDLSYYLKSPKSGKYQMEIIVQLEKRQKHLLRDVCVANLTVSASESFIRMEANVTLWCNITCLDNEGRLCWYHSVIGSDFCGLPGQKTFSKNITTVTEMLGNWTCRVRIGEDIKASVNLTVVLTPGFLHPSNPMLWVTVAVGVLVILFTVLIITVMTARCRRMRRARHRAWLLENLHQQRVCECNGFAPKRLRENI